MRTNWIDVGLRWVSYHTADGPPLFLVRSPDRAGKGSGAVITFIHHDLASLHDRLQEAGVKVDPKVHEGNGIRLLTFYDPDGNTLEVSQER